MKSTKKRRIVSSRHLADVEFWQLSEVEYGLIIAFNSFSRWVSHCMSASGNSDLSHFEILILHNIYHRNRSKRLVDIGFMINIEDIHTVNYAVKKLVKYKLVVGKKIGKEIFYSTTRQGKLLCEKYAEIRKLCLQNNEEDLNVEGEKLQNLARELRKLSGRYDQASRAASSL